MCWWVFCQCEAGRGCLMRPMRGVARAKGWVQRPQAPRWPGELSQCQEAVVTLKFCHDGKVQDKVKTVKSAGGCETRHTHHSSNTIQAGTKGKGWNFCSQEKRGSPCWIFFPIFLRDVLCQANLLKWPSYQRATLSTERCNFPGGEVKCTTSPPKKRYKISYLQNIWKTPSYSSS